MLADVLSLLAEKGLVHVNRCLGPERYGDCIARPAVQLQYFFAVREHDVRIVIRPVILVHRHRVHGYVERLERVNEQVVRIRALVYSSLKAELYRIGPLLARVGYYGRAAMA